MLQYALRGRRSVQDNDDSDNDDNRGQLIQEGRSAFRGADKFSLFFSATACCADS